MKIYVFSSQENWICDRFTKEWNQFNSGITINNPYEADIIWLLSGWEWRTIPLSLLENKTVVTTIHHIDPIKVDQNFVNDFNLRDQITDFYHVPCERTQTQIEKYTKKPILNQQFWANQLMWFPIKNKDSLKSGLKLPLDKTLLGSFQRDTEGHDLKSPKLSKGPDIFCDIVERFHSENPDIEVILSGWRRQYVIKRLNDAGIKYHYFEWASFDVLNKLYNCLDLYVVSSRFEGGPQSIVECALTKTPIISTDVGFAANILAPESLYESHENTGKPNVEVAHKNIQEYIIPRGFEKFVDFFKTL